MINLLSRECNLKNFNGDVQGKIMSALSILNRSATTVMQFMLLVEEAREAIDEALAWIHIYNDQGFDDDLVDAWIRYTFDDTY